MAYVSVIAIDGPVASGKTAVGRLLSQRLGYRFLDTGLMYRAVTALALRTGVDPNNEQRLTSLARSARLDVTQRDGRDRVQASGEDITDSLRTRDVENAVSLVSKVIGVREALVAQQRRMVAGGRMVMVGRDIGTVVLVDAPLKLFLKASPEVRAKRRLAEQQANGGKATFEDVLANVRLRDDLDTNRAVSPLKPASDAKIIDTDGLTLQQVVDKALALAERD